MDNKMIFMSPISEKVFDGLIKTNSANFYRKGYSDGFLVGAGVGIVTTVCTFVLTQTIFKIGETSGKKTAKNTYTVDIPDEEE